jgi:catechol 2,3-dioxygenase-like lactoylglutathione lyase family enzyme
VGSVAPQDGADRRKSEETCDVLAMITALHSAVVDVPDFEAAVRDYTHLIGRGPARIESNSARSTRSAFFDLANMSLELRARLATQEAGEPAEAGGRGFGQSGIRLAWDAMPPPAAGNTGSAADLILRSSQAEQAQIEGGIATRRWQSVAIDPKSSRGLSVELIADEEIAGGADFEGKSDSVDPAACIRALDHVVLLSADPEDTRAFYADRLGIRLALDRSFEKRGVRLLFFRVGGTTLEIGARLGVEAQPDRPDAFGGLAWQVVEMEAIHARLAGEGFDVSGIRDGNKPGTRVCTVRDPVHGVPTLLIEPVG